MKSLNFTRKILSTFVLAFTFLFVGSVEGQVYWDGSSTNFTSCSISNLNNAIIGSTQGNNNGSTSLITTTSASLGYTTTCNGNQSASGSSNFGAACKIGVLNTSSSTYFSIALTPNANYKVSLLSLCFGSRGTSTGPSLVTIYSSIDNYQTALGSISLNPNTGWEAKTISFSGANLVGATSTAVTLRIYGSGGTGSPSPNTANWRIDDLTINATAISSWTGSTSSDPNVAANWSPAAVPASTASVVIPTGLTNYPSFTNNSTPSFASITIDAGASLTLQTGSQLTLTGTLTNNGTMTIESGATLVQATNSSTISGTGTYIVKQALPTNRYWYLGVPIGAYTEASFLSNLTNGETLKKRDEAGNQWVTVTSNSTAIPAGRGYYVQNPTSTPTITFQGTGAGSAFNNGVITTENLTSAGSGFQGFNLVSNPYPSYIDWTTVTKTNVGTTMWYRTHDGSGMNFGTVNGSGVGTTIGATIVTKYIPPMQSFWVRVSSFGQAASLTFNNTDRSHFIAENNSVAGLKSSNDNDFVLIRMNLKQAEKMDQLIVYTEDQATNGLDNLDADKMMQANYPQFYTSVGGKKIVINALNASKKQQSLPITMELPTTGVHSFIIEDLEISNGLVWLEDKQEEIIQALEPGTVYEFYAASGMNAERFVLHFQLIDEAVPTNVYNEVNSSANFSGKGASVYAESAGVVVIKLPASAEGVTDIQIRDAAGKLVYAGSMNNLETSVELAQANGIYYVTLSSNTGVEVRKVFIQQ